jgi:N-methylhydantoinase A
VEGRVDPDGATIEPLSECHMLAAIEKLRQERVRSVAVCFMHSYANGEHEAIAGTLLDEHLPNAYVALSHELLCEPKFYERVSTTVINAFVGPILRDYLEELDRKLRKCGFSGALRVMKSNGGIMSPSVAAKEAAHTLLSGPAGAVSAATHYSAVHELPDCIVMDMGGTSFDVSLIESGSPLVTREGGVARYRIMLPILDIHTVGAGGGSIAKINVAGLLEVGPASAGSTPGPACYARGGDQPTVTDADVVLGYINPEYFLGGRMPLDRELAERAILKEIAEPLGVSMIQAAAGIFDVINAKMAGAIREVSVQRGNDPRKFVLITAGGASAVHVAAIARDLEIGRIMIPRDPGVFSALGMLTTDFKHDFVGTYRRRLSEANLETVNAHFAGMKAQGVSTLRSEGVVESEIAHTLKMDLHYEGQIHEVEVVVEENDLKKPGLTEIHRKFHDRHATLFGYSTQSDEVEIVNLRVTSVGKTWKMEVGQRTWQSEVDASSLKGWRRVYFPHHDDLLEVPVHDGALLETEKAIAGPAIVEFPDTSVVVDEYYDITCDVSGNCLLTMKSQVIAPNVGR